MDSDVAQVIDRTDLIENLMNQIIEKFISPRKEAFPFFWTIFLDGSIISLGTKVRLVILISQEVGIKINQEPLRRVVRLRNAFAHHGLQSHPTLLIGKNPEEDKLVFELQTINSSLKLKRISREKASEDFNKNYHSAKKILVEFKKELESQIVLK